VTGMPELDQENEPAATAMLYSTRQGQTLERILVSVCPRDVYVLDST
jgi:hypothetical protein